MFNKVIRPWGFYIVLKESKDYIVKELVINPNNRISLQRHNHRVEYWTVIKANKATITIDDNLYLCSDGQQFVIQPKQMHRAECLGPDPLVIIEVQMGKILDESDIERIQDDYNRN